MRVVILAIVLVVGFVAANSVFIVEEREKVVMFRLGELVRADFDPGIYFKLPLIHNIRRFDRRILSMDTAPERFLTNEKKNVIVDFFVKWRIEDAAQFYRSTRGDVSIAIARLQQIIKNGLRDEFGARTIQEAISGERAVIMSEVQNLANEKTQELGISIVDVRIRRIDLPAEVSTSVFQRMEKERATVAKSFRSRGEKEAQTIRADADRQRVEILAEANRQAQILKGEGDAKAAEIYAQAFSQDAEFYELYRSLNGYRTAFSSRQDVLVLGPDDWEFFQFLRGPNAAGFDTSVATER